MNPTEEQKKQIAGVFIALILIYAVYLYTQEDDADLEITVIDEDTGEIEIAEIVSTDPKEETPEVDEAVDEAVEKVVEKVIKIVPTKIVPTKAVPKAKSVLKKAVKKAARKVAPAKIVTDIKLTHSKQFINVTEVELYNKKGRKINIKGSKATSSSWGWKGPPKNIVDGNINTLAHTKNAAKEWINVKLIKPLPYANISKLRLWNRPGKLGRRSNGIRIALYNNGKILKQWIVRGNRRSYIFNSQMRIRSMKGKPRKGRARAIKGIAKMRVKKAGK